MMDEKQLAEMEELMSSDLPMWAVLGCRDLIAEVRRLRGELETINGQLGSMHGMKRSLATELRGARQKERERIAKHFEALEEGTALHMDVPGLIRALGDDDVLSPEQAAKLRQEGADLRKELERRTAPMKRVSAKDKP